MSAKALVKHTELPATEIVKEALTIASTICIYTNNQFTIEKLVDGEEEK